MRKGLKQFLIILIITAAVCCIAAASAACAKHKHGFSKTVVAPTCTEEGFTVFKCDCGESYFEDYTPALGHNIVEYRAQAATCIFYGWGDYEACTRCEYSTREVIKALGHEFTDYSGNDDATCTKNGTETAKCNRCSATDTREVADTALGHSLMKHSGFEPTCRINGWADYETCRRCDYTSFEELPALGHEFIDYLSNGDATCTQNAFGTAKCTRCDATDMRELKDTALGHDYLTHAAKAATCTEAGWEEYVSCARDGCKYTTYQEVAAGHIYVFVPAKAATCTESGWNSYSFCRRNCGYNSYEEIPALGHNIRQVSAKNATCTQSGWNAYDYCTNDGCGYTTYQTIAPTGHKFEREWSTDEDYHWHASACGHGTLKSGYGAHEWQGNTCGQCSLTVDYSTGLSYTPVYENGVLIGYSVTGKGAVLDQNVVIPSEYKGLPVVGIGGNAFSRYTNIKTVTMPATVKTIGNSAFYGCTGLVTLSIPEGLTEIGDSAFSGCTGLTGVVIPVGVERIGNAAFMGCNGLQSISLPFTGESKSATALSEKSVFGYIFGYERGIWQADDIRQYDDCYYHIPKSLTQVAITGDKILDYSFYRCENLLSVTVGDGVKTIGEYAFAYCTELLTAKLGSGLQIIERYAFFRCFELTGIAIPDKVTEIGSHAFFNCNCLATVTLGKSLHTIGFRVFFGCFCLAEVVNYSALDIVKGSETHGYVAYYAEVVRNESSAA